MLKRVEKFESDLEVARRDRLARHDLEVEMRAQFETELDAALQEAAAKIKQLRGERGEARSALDETAARLEEFKAQAAAREASSGNGAVGELHQVLADKQAAVQELGERVQDLLDENEV